MLMVNKPSMRAINYPHTDHNIVKVYLLMNHNHYFTPRAETGWTSFKDSGGLRKMEPAQVHKDLETLVPLFSCNDRDSIHRIHSKYPKFLNASGRSNASKLFRDELSATIMPSDIPEPNLTPITTTGNGDCLFNAASLHIKGDETLASTIRLLSSCELFLNAGYYADHPILAEASTKPGIISKDKNTLLSVLLTRHEEHELNLNSNNSEMYVKADAINMLKPRVWSPMLQVLSLANVLNCTVYSVYPDVNAAIRPLLNGSIFPIEKESGKRIFYVMWTRDGNLDSRPGSLFQPNHFCFVAHDHQIHVNTNGNTMSKRKPFTSSQQNEKKKLKVSSKGQLTMVSFLQKKFQEDNTAGAKTDPEGKPAQDPSVEKDELSVDDRNRRESDVSSTYELTQSKEKKEDMVPDTVESKEYLQKEQPSEQELCKAICCQSDAPYQPCDGAVLDSSARTYKKRERKFLASWFTDFSWLTYCLTTNKVCCAICRNATKNNLITFSTKTETAFLTQGFNNWKKCPAAFRDHELSSSHKEVVQKQEYIRKGTNVRKGVAQQQADSQRIHRACLMKQLSSLKYLLQQGSALRGHVEAEGNLYTLMTLRSEDYAPITDWQKDKQYQSPSIVNEQITMFGHYILRSIVKNISNAKWYSILADETRDVSNKEQLTVCIRWVDESFTINEDFIGLVELTDTKASTIFASIKDVLLRLGLSMNMCRGQGYDGASNFMGHLNGVARKFQDEVPQAVTVHCFAHCLNLSLQDSCRQLKPVRDAMDLVKEISALITNSPKRQNIFEKIQSNFGINSKAVRPLCPTRWTVRTGAIGAILENYEALQETMEEINVSGNDDYSRRAGGVVSLMTKFETYFGLELSHMLFAATEQLSTNIQYKDSCVKDAVNGSKMVLSFLDRQRNEDSFDSFYQSAERKASTRTEEPCLPRYKKVPKRLDSGSENVRFESAKGYYRQIYNEAIDILKGQLEKRFISPNLNIAHQIEELLLNAANGSDITISQSIKDMYKEDVDMNKLKTQLTLMEDMVKNSSLKVKKVTSIRTIFDMLNDQSGAKTFMSAVALLLKLYLTLPVTTATAERSFSCLRRVKTFLRSTMTQCRMNNIMLLHCHKELTKQIEVVRIAAEFISRNIDRKQHFGNFEEEIEKLSEKHNLTE